MTRYAIDAPTLLHIVTEELAINPEHQLVAPDAEYLAVTLLQADALVTVDPAMAKLADGLVSLARSAR